MVNLGLRKSEIESRILNNEYDFEDVINMARPERFIEEIASIHKDEKLSYTLGSFGFSQTALDMVNNGGGNRE